MQAVELTDCIRIYINKIIEYAVEVLKTLPAEVFVVTKESGENGVAPRTVIEITIYEGRNRQIRRMCEAVGLEVIRLKRVAFGGIKLGMLPPGQWRHLEPKEVRTLVQASKVE